MRQTTTKITAGKHKLERVNEREFPLHRRRNKTWNLQTGAYIKISADLSERETPRVHLKCIMPAWCYGLFVCEREMNWKYNQTRSLFSFGNIFLLAISLTCCCFVPLNEKQAGSLNKRYESKNIIYELEFLLWFDKFAAQSYTEDIFSGMNKIFLPYHQF